MTIVIETKLDNGKLYKHRYEGVVKYACFPKEEVKTECDETTYNDMAKYVFRMYFKDSETSTWSCTRHFKYKVLFHD